MREHQNKHPFGASLEFSSAFAHLHHQRDIKHSLKGHVSYTHPPTLCFIIRPIQCVCEVISIISWLLLNFTMKRANDKVGVGLLLCLSACLFVLVQSTCCCCCSTPDEDYAQGRIYLFRWTYLCWQIFRSRSNSSLSTTSWSLRSFEMSNQRAKNITTSHSFIVIIIMITRYKDEWIANREILIITPATLWWCDGGTLGDIVQLKLLNQDSQQQLVLVMSATILARAFRQLNKLKINLAPFMLSSITFSQPIMDWLLCLELFTVYIIRCTLMRCDWRALITSPRSHHHHHHLDVIWSRDFFVIFTNNTARSRGRYKEVKRIFWIMVIVADFPGSRQW